MFRLRFTAMIWWVITFPMFGFFFCIIWSLVFHFEYTVATDCGVSAKLPRSWVRARLGDGGKIGIREWEKRGRLRERGRGSKGMAGGIYEQGQSKSGFLVL